MSTLSGVNGAVKLLLLLSLIFQIGIGFTFAQIVYWNPEPDVVVNVNNPVFPLDVNLDGQNDFVFQVEKIDYSSFYELRYLIDAWPNELWGYNSHTTSPDCLEEGVWIGPVEAWKFQEAPNILATTRYSVDSNGTINELSYTGLWPNQSICSDDFHFVGIKVKFLGGSRFGWIRIKTDFENQQLILDAFAFDARVGYGIETGEFPYLADEIEVTGYENLIYVNLPEYFHEKVLNCNIYSMSGAVVFSKKVASGKTCEIELPLLAPGLYILTIDLMGVQRSCTFNHGVH
jgi:hypothetical protein